MKMSVTTTETTYEVPIKPADLVAFERKFDVAWEDVQEKPKIEYMFFLAWNASRRTGVTTDEFDVWLDRVDDLDPVEEVPLEPSPASS